LNASFTDNLGLLNGKMGIAIFFYQYARYTGNKVYEDYAGELIDEIYSDIRQDCPINELMGVGWGIEYLTKNKYVVTDTDEALFDIDKYVFQSSISRPILIGSSNDIFTYGLYYISRLGIYNKNLNNLSTLLKQHHVIHLIDECERLLVQKQFKNFGYNSLSINTINSFLWFLLEANKLNVFPVKVEKILCNIQEYIELGLNNSEDLSGKILLLNLCENITAAVNDPEIRKSLRQIINKNRGLSIDLSQPEGSVIDNFIKSSWQYILYAPYTSKITPSLKNEDIHLIDDEDKWNQRLDKLNKDNLGLSGLTGLGLGILLSVKDNLFD